MSIKRSDPRTEKQKEIDENMQNALEKGTLARATPDERKKAIIRAKQKKEARKRAARLGLVLAEMRQECNMTQKDLADAIGTKHSDISRIESGRYGGLTIERFLMIFIKLIANNESLSENLRYGASLEKCVPQKIAFYEDINTLEESQCTR